MVGWRSCGQVATAGARSWRTSRHGEIEMLRPAGVGVVPRVPRRMTAAQIKKVLVTPRRSAAAGVRHRPRLRAE